MTVGMSGMEAQQVERPLRKRGLSKLRTAGFACDRLWTFLMFYSIVPYLTVPDIRGALYMNMFASLCSMTVALMFIGIVSRREYQLHDNRTLALIAALVMAGGTCGTYFADTSTTTGILVFGGCALSTGFGSAVLLICWLELASEHGVRGVIEIALGVCVALAAGLLACFLPGVVSGVCIIAAPLASYALLVRAHNEPARPKDPSDHTHHEPDRLSTSTIVLFTKGLIGVFAVGIIAGFFDVFTGYRTFTVSNQYGPILFVCGIAIMSISLAVVLKTKHDALSWLYRIAVFALCVGCLCTLFLNDQTAISGGIVFAGYLVFSVVLFIVCSNVHRAFGLSITRLFAFSFSTLYAGEIVGDILAIVFGNETAHDMLSLFTLVSVMWLIFTHLFLFDEIDMISIGLGEVGSMPIENGVEDAEQSKTVDASAVIAEKYGLTPRESEVLPLLLQGRTIARIQDALFISQGTVSTHIRHIYRKTGVANRQGLLDLAEHIDDEGREA